MGVTAYWELGSGPAAPHFEGVLRHWSQSHAPGEEGLLRDSAMFSVIASEWPAAKAALGRRLARV